MQLHQYDMLQPGTLGLLARIRELMERYPGSVTMGEVSSQPGAFDRVVRYTAGDQWLHMAYTLRPLRGGFDWLTLSGMMDELAAAGEAGWPCWSFSNHDVERAVSRWNPRRGKAAPDAAFARLLMAVLLSLRGSVSLYQGEELGLTEAELRPEHLRDPFGIAYWPEFRGVTAAARRCHGNATRRMAASPPRRNPGCRCRSRIAPWPWTAMRRTGRGCCMEFVGFWRGAGVIRH